MEDKESKSEYEQLNLFDMPLPEKAIEENSCGKARDLELQMAELEKGKRNQVKKSFGTMMGGDDALKLLDQIYAKINPLKEEKGFLESFPRMRNRFAYHIDQAKPVKLKYHKGKYGSKYDSWTCQNCGCTITHGVIQNFCWNCGHRLAWDNPRCLTGYKEA